MCLPQRGTSIDFRENDEIKSFLLEHEPRLLQGDEIKKMKMKMKASMLK